MRIARIAIHGFRSLVHQEVMLEPYSILIGRNNAGKTNLIDAIRVFYDKDIKFIADRDRPHRGANGDESWIDVFYSLTRDEYESLPEVYQWRSNALWVRKWLRGAEGERKDGEIYAYVGEDQIHTSPFHGALGVGKGKLGTVVYVPAVSKVDEHTKLSGPSALRDLVQDILRGLAKSNDAFGALQEKFGELASGLKHERDANGRSLSFVESQLSAAMEDWGSQFKLTVEPPSDDVILKNLVNHAIEDKTTGKELAPGQLGSGFQRHLIYSLISLQARMEQKEIESKKKQFDPDFTLLLFEEPEAFLHPAQQRVLHHEFRAISKDESRQVLCSSHSPHFVSNQLEDLTSIARLQRENGVTDVRQMQRADIEEIATGSVEVRRILADDQDGDAADEAAFFFLQVDPRRASMFYCDHVLLVEGAADRVLIEWLRDNGRLKLGRRTLEVIDCEGKFHVHRYLMLCNKFGIRHSVIVDEDCDKLGKELKKQQDLNKHLEGLARVTQCAGFSYVTPNLETMLGIPVVTDRGSRKPRIILKHLRDQTIDYSKLKAFTALVQGNLDSQPSLGGDG